MKTLNRKTIIIIIVGLAILLAGGFGIYQLKGDTKPPLVNDSQADPMDRPTTEENWYLNKNAGTENEYQFKIGQGIVGEEKLGLLRPTSDWVDVRLPTTGQPGVWPGNTLKITGDDFLRDQELKGWIFPYGTSTEDDKAITVDVPPNESTREAVYDMLIPTNLSEGSYTVRIQTYQNVYFFDILVIPSGEIVAQSQMKE